MRRADARCPDGGDGLHAQSGPITLYEGGAYEHAIALSLRIRMMRLYDAGVQ